MMQLRIFSKLISALFHPLVMPILALFLGVASDSLLELYINPARLTMVYLIVALTTIVFPVVSFLFLYRAKEISDLQMTIRKERFKPLITTILYYSLGYYLLRKGELPATLLTFIFGCILATIFATIINLKYKISLHAIGIAGVMGYLCALFHLHDNINIYILFGVIIISGLVLTSRLILKVHTQKEIYMGAFLGFFIIYLAVANALYI